jgi:phage-related protein
MAPLLPFVAIAAAVAGAIYGIWWAWDSNFWGFRDGLMWIYNEGILPLWNLLVSVFTPAWNQLVTAFQNLWASIQPLVQALWAQLQPALMSIWNAIQPYLLPVLGILAAIILGPVLLAIGLFIAIIYATIHVVTFLVNTTTQAVEWMKANWASLAAVVVARFGTQINWIRQFIGVVGQIVGKVQNAVNGAKSAFDILRNIDLYQIGVNIIQGLINGIASMTGAVQAKAGEIANSVKNTISGALQISSPSKLMEQFGKWTGQGLAIGMNQSQFEVASASANLAANAVAPMANTNNNINQNNTFNVSGSNANDITNEITQKLARQNKLAFAGANR